jgi:hypothetical protein
MYVIRLQQTDSGPSFEFRTRATTLRGAKRAASKHKDLLAYDGQGGVTLTRLVEVEGYGQQELPEASGNIPRGHSRLTWDN